MLKHFSGALLLINYQVNAVGLAQMTNNLAEVQDDTIIELGTDEVAPDLGTTEASGTTTDGGSNLGYTSTTTSMTVSTGGTSTGGTLLNTMERLGVDSNLDFGDVLAFDAEFASLVENSDINMTASKYATGEDSVVLFDSLEGAGQAAMSTSTATGEVATDLGSLIDGGSMSLMDKLGLLNDSSLEAELGSDGVDTAMFSQVAGLLSNDAAKTGGILQLQDMGDGSMATLDGLLAGEEQVADHLNEEYEVATQTVAALKASNFQNLGSTMLSSEEVLANIKNDSYDPSNLMSGGARDAMGLNQVDNSDLQQHIADFKIMNRVQLSLDTDPYFQDDVLGADLTNDEYESLFAQAESTRQDDEVYYQED